MMLPDFDFWTSTTIDQQFDEAVADITADLRADRLTIDEWSDQLHELEREYRDYLDPPADGDMWLHTSAGPLR